MKNLKTLPSLTIALVLGLNAGYAVAADCGERPSVSIQALSSEEVANDRVRMHWSVQIEREDSAASMKDVNSALEKALKQLKGQKQVLNIKTNIQTYPVYGKNRLISSWRGTGNLSFEMALSDLEENKEINISEPLALRSLEYFTSDTVEEESRTRLLGLAMEEFKAKAAVVSKGFDYDGYKLSTINVNDERQYGGPVPMMRAMATSADSSMRTAEVAASGGTSQMSVSVNGQVCLLRN